MGGAVDFGWRPHCFSVGKCKVCTGALVHGLAMNMFEDDRRWPRAACSSSGLRPRRAHSRNNIGKVIKAIAVAACSDRYAIDDHRAKYNRTKQRFGAVEIHFDAIDL